LSDRPFVHGDGVATEGSIGVAKRSDHGSKTLDRHASYDTNSVSALHVVTSCGQRFIARRASIVIVDDSSTS